MSHPKSDLILVQLLIHFSDLFSILPTMETKTDAETKKAVLELTMAVQKQRCWRTGSV